MFFKMFRNVALTYKKVADHWNSVIEYVIHMSNGDIIEKKNVNLKYLAGNHN